MRIIVLAVLVLPPPLATVQPTLEATRVAEFAAGLSQPHDAEFDKAGRLLVADTGNVIVTNTRSAALSVLRDGRLERTVDGRGSRDGEFSNPHDVEAAGNGGIYVVDSGNDRVVLLRVE